MTQWKKGQSGNPKGRPPVLRPELQSALDRNRNAVKELTLSLLSMTPQEMMARAENSGISVTEALLIKCIERATNDGDIFRGRAILEIVFGRLPEEKPEFEVTPEERLLVEEYRRRLLEKDDGSSRSA